MEVLRELGHDSHVDGRIAQNAEGGSLRRPLGPRKHSCVLARKFSPRYVLKYVTFAMSGAHAHR